MPFMNLKGPLVKIFLTSFEKGCSVLTMVCYQKGTIFQWKIYQRGTFPVISGI